MKTLRVLTLVSLCFALLGSTAFTQQHPLSLNFVAASALDAVEGHLIVMSGEGSFDPDGGAVQGAGIFAQWYDDAEGVPKPIVGVGSGTWRVTSLEGWTPQGETYGPITPGVLDLVLELTADDGEVMEARLRVICNVGPGGLVNMENDRPLPEGYILAIPEVGTFNPIIAEEPGVPPVGLTWIGPTPPTGAPAAGGM